MIRRRAPLLLVTLALLAWPAGSAHAVVVVAAPSNELLENFATPIAASTTSGPLYLLNTDVVEHSIVSYALRPDYPFRPWCVEYDRGFCPLFWSRPVVQGVSAVEGLDDTTAGEEYPFYCGVHPTMHGTLTILA